MVAQSGIVDFGCLLGDILAGKAEHIPEYSLDPSGGKVVSISLGRGIVAFTGGTGQQKYFHFYLVLNGRLPRTSSEAAAK